MEILVMIAVLAVLVALLAPHLAGARASARATQSTSNLRQIGAVIELYSHAEGSWYPFGTPGEPYSISLPGEGDVLQSWGTVFAFGRAWPVLMRGVVEWEEFAPTWISPGTPGDDGLTFYRFGYAYSHSFLARPELWYPDALPDPWLLRGVRTDEVTFPASKVMFWDFVLAYELRPVELMPKMLANPAPMLFADGHVAVHAPGDASPPVVNTLNPGADEARQPLHNTPNGVRGMDYR